MKRALLVVIISLSGWVSLAQTFEITGLQESYRGIIGEVIKAPIRFKNTSDKPITLIVRKVTDQIGTTQKNFFCLDNSCFDHRVEDYILKIEPGQTLSNFQVALEAGLVPGVSSAKYVAFSKSNPGHTVDFEVNFTVDESPEKQYIYSSRQIVLHEVYPNPVIDNAFVNYRLLSDAVKAKIIVHNILGNIVGEYTLPQSENLVRIKTDDLSAGIYFYTLYVGDKATVTQKFMVKK
jgi:hypothetical protein